MVAQAASDDASAQERLQRAIAAESDSQKRERYVQRLMDNMLSAGSALDAYRAAPDARQAFQYLAGAYESYDRELSAASLAELVAAHREGHADDPWLDYYSGLALEAQGHREQAQATYAAGMAKVDDESIVESYRYHWLRIAATTGDGLAAYGQCDDADAAFRQLAGAWADDRNAESVELLRSLVELHRGRNPDDPWLDYYAAVVARHDDDHDRADGLLEEGYRKAADESLKSACLDLLLDSPVPRNRTVSAILELRSLDDTFSPLASALFERERWDELTELVTVYRQLRPATPLALAWEAEALWQRGEYDRVVRLLSPFPSQQARLLGTAAARDLGRQLVRSLLRSGQKDAAITAAKVVYNQLGDALPMTLACAASGDARRTTQYLSELRANQYVVTDLYYDEDVGNILRSPEFHEVRQASPPGLRYYGQTTHSAVLLLSEPRAFDLQAWRAAISIALGGEVQLSELPGTDAERPASYYGRGQGFFVCLTVGNSSYVANDSTGRTPPESPALREAMASHQAWLAVDLTPDYAARLDDAAVRDTISRLVAPLVSSDTLAVYDSEEWRLMTADDFSPRVWREAANERTTPGVGEQYWLQQDAPQRPEEDDARRRLSELAAAFRQRGPTDTFAVRARLELGHASEEHWLDVERITKNEYGNWKMYCSFTTEPHLERLFTAGDPVILYGYDVTAWRYTRDGATIRSTEPPD